MYFKRFTMLNPVKSVRLNFKISQLFAMFLRAIGLNGLQAQTSIHTAGWNASGNGGSVSNSVEQVVYTTHTGTNGSVAQGVQQPYEISVVTGIKKFKELNLFVSVYPNPATDYLTLDVKEFEFTNISFQLYDINGKLLQSEKIMGKQTSIVMSNLAPATYFVKVISGNQSIKEFKIIKTQ